MASGKISYNEEETECSIELEGSETVIDCDLSDGDLVTFQDDAGEKYVFSIDNEDLGEHTLYKVLPIELQEVEDDEAEDGAETESA